MHRIKTNAQFTEGGLFFKILIFTLPIIATNILTLLYNTADQVVVGQFSGDPNALAAVGSTGNLTNLIVNLLFGMTAGTSVIVARSYGAKDKEALSCAVHTSMLFSIIGGVIVMIIGLSVCRVGLSLMGTKEDIFEQAVLYMSIILLGVPATSVFNFAATIIRSTGDSKTPFIILASTGVVNVVFNLVFVIVFSLGVAGVAISTIISQYLSAIWAVYLLVRTDEDYRMSFRKLKFDRAMLRQVLLIGIPSGIQGSLFSISNILVQSSVNTFSTPEVSGNTIAGTLEGYAYTAGNCFYQSVITFVGQNYGAGKYDRVKKSFIYCMIQAACAVLIVSSLELLFIDFLVPFFVDMQNPLAPQIVDAAMVRLNVLLALYFLCGFMDVLTGYLRSLGMSILPMITSVFAICVLRSGWCLFVFPAFGTPMSLYAVFPISWAACVLINGILAFFVSRKMMPKTKKQEVVSPL